MYSPSKEEFVKAAKKGNLIPVSREIPADLETPVSAFLKLADNSRYGYLLESVEGQEKIARYSFIAGEPCAMLTIKDKSFSILALNSSGELLKKQTKVLGDPLLEIKKFMSRYKFVDIKGSPRFCGGLVGYIGYDIVRFFEDIPDKNPPNKDIADSIFLLTDTLLIFDHLTNRIKIVSCAYLGGKSPKLSLSSYSRSINKIENIIHKLGRPLREKKNQGIKKYKISSATGKSEFLNSVKKAKKYIRNGDIIQVVLSQVVEMNLHKRPFDIYRKLRSLNPSAYMFYLKLDKLCLLGSSPEMLVRCENNIVTTRPIAGTRARGKTQEEDARLEKDLLSDAKEKAEHIMLVDLGRNDLGRVCEFKSIKISEFMRVERYSHVMHIVSEVQGSLKKGKDIYKVLRAAFPAGTVTGSPKVRAMEIIDELENRRRGPYAGAVGYFSFSGNLDTCITIRTIVVNNKTAYVQAGAGIVADSKPEREYQETLNKAQAQFEALKT